MYSASHIFVADKISILMLMVRGMLYTVVLPKTGLALFVYKLIEVSISPLHCNRVTSLNITILELSIPGSCTFCAKSHSKAVHIKVDGKYEYVFNFYTLKVSISISLENNRG